MKLLLLLTAALLLPGCVYWGLYVVAPLTTPKNPFPAPAEPLTPPTP